MGLDQLLGIAGAKHVELKSRVHENGVPLSKSGTSCPKSPHVKADRACYGAKGPAREVCTPMNIPDISKQKHSQFSTSPRATGKSTAGKLWCIALLLEGRPKFSFRITSKVVYLLTPFYATHTGFP